MTLQKKKSISYAKYGYLFSLPFVIAYLVFHLYPTVYTAILGFTDCKGLGNTNWHFLKDDIWKNFRTILNNATFKTSLKNTVVLWIMNFFPQITLALLLTAWFTSKRVLFGYPKGPVNDILVSLGLRSEAFFFTNSATASRWIIAFIQFWMWYGYTMIILISGVLGINPEIYEAAEIDGANDWQTFWQITIPNLRTILTYTLITSMIGGLNMYDMSKMFNNGNPNNSTLTTSVFIYNQAFAGSYMYNRAAAASMIMFVIIAFFSIIVFYLMRDRKS